MKVVSWYEKRLSNSINLHFRYFSMKSESKFEQGFIRRNAVATTLPILHSLLQLCAKERQLVQGKTCHAQLILLGLKQDTITSNMLMNMYSKCALIDSARKVFDQMTQRSLVSWNTMIGAYTHNGDAQKALSLFLDLLREGGLFSEFTLSSALCACAAKGDAFSCKQLHAFATKAAMDANAFVGNALLNIYAKTGSIKDAVWVFEGISYKNAVAWSSMVAGYVQNQLYEEAMGLFLRAQMMGIEYDQFTLSSVICACAGLAALIEGRQMHSIVCKTGFGSNNFVASSIVDMYAKCGIVKESYIAFLDAEGRNNVLWNAMVSGFAKHSYSLEVMILFEKMQQIGICPDEVTYVSLLSSCSHMGLVDLGRSYFKLMTEQHNLSPNVLHYACMVDILGRAGLIQEAYDLIKQMPFAATASMWGSILASCRTHGSLEFAEIAAKNLFQIEPDNAGNYVLLSNAYAANKKWKEAAEAKKLLKENEMKKEIGKSWIEIKDKVHVFMVGERKHPRISDIYVELDKLLERMMKLGYKAETVYDLHDVDECLKKELLVHHSEKLALTFGIICLPPAVPIRIIKNLRICGDCHSFMKFASSITKRDIIVRDVNRFHHFRGGCCSCREFW